MPSKDSRTVARIRGITGGGGQRISRSLVISLSSPLPRGKFGTFPDGIIEKEGGGGSLHKVLCNSRSIDSIIVHETIISGTRHRLYNGRSGATNTSIDNHPVTCSVGNRVTLIALIDARATADVDRPLVIIIQD